MVFERAEGTHIEGLGFPTLGQPHTHHPIPRADGTPGRSLGFPTLSLIHIFPLLAGHSFPLLIVSERRD